MILNTRHTGIVVRDLNKSLRFYIDLLGLSIWKRITEEGDFIDKVVALPGAKIEWVKLKAPDNSLVELIEYHSHPATKKIENSDSNTLGCSHIAFTVENLERLYGQLCEHGVHCNSCPQLSPDGKVKVLYCHDPDGVIVELVEEL